MITRVLKNSLLLVCFILLANKVSASDWPEMPFIKNAKVNVVSESMIFNGVPMQTWTMTSQESLETITAFYREQWKTIEDSLYDEQVIDGWVYINSKQDDGFILTAKLKSNLGNTHGYMGLSNPERQLKNYKRGSNFPRPRGAEVLNDIAEKNSGKKQRFLLMTTPQTIARTYDFYIKEFSKKGWLTQSSAIDPEQKNAFIAMNRDADELNISISKVKNQNQIMASLVERSMF